MLGKLYIVATPIGNLSDITLRAVELLKAVDIILAEDTRVTGKLLNHYEIDKSILSYHQHSSESKRQEILSLLVDGKSVALVTDAGTPGISDPGNELIDWVQQRLPELKVVPVPGSSALVAALSVSGFRSDKFVFLGFLPKKKRKKIFEWLREGKSTFAFYESPKRILKTLGVLRDEFGGDNRVFIGRELTKIHEQLYRGSIDTVIKDLEGTKGAIKGEIVVIVELK